MIREPQLTVHATIDTDNQRLKKKTSKITEVFLNTTIDIPSARPAIKFEPVKAGRPEDLHLYVHAKDPSFMREITLAEGAAEDEALFAIDVFLSDLQNSLDADYVRVDFSEGIVVYQHVGQIEVEKVDLANLEGGKYLPTFHQIQNTLRKTIDNTERVEYLERKPGFRGVDQTNLLSPPLTERFSTLNQVIVPRLLQNIKTERKKMKFLERIIFLDALVKKLTSQASTNMTRAQWNLEEVQQTASTSELSDAKNELEEAKKNYEMLRQLDFAALYTIAAHLENKNSKNHISAARQIEKFLSSNLAVLGKKSWEHQENFAKKTVSLLTLNRIWGKLQPLTTDESDYSYRMGSLSLPAGDRILYKEYIKESGKEIIDMPIMQVLIEAMRHFPEGSLNTSKELLEATPYGLLGVEEAIRSSREETIEKSEKYATSDLLVQHLRPE